MAEVSPGILLCDALQSLAYGCLQRIIRSCLGAPQYPLELEKCVLYRVEIR